MNINHDVRYDVHKEGTKFIKVIQLWTLDNISISCKWQWEEDIGIISRNDKVMFKIVQNKIGIIEQFDHVGMVVFFYWIKNKIEVTYQSSRLCRCNVCMAPHTILKHLIGL